MPRHSLSLLVASAAIVTIGAVGCGGGGNRPAHAQSLEGPIAAQVEKNTGRKVESVDCPEHTSTVIGSTFQCSLTTADGGKFTVTMKNTRLDVQNNSSFSSIVKITKAGQ